MFFDHSSEYWISLIPTKSTAGSPKAPSSIFFMLYWSIAASFDADFTLDGMLYMVGTSRILTTSDEARGKEFSEPSSQTKNSLLHKLIRSVAYGGI